MIYCDADTSCERPALFELVDGSLVCETCYDESTEGCAGCDARALPDELKRTTPDGELLCPDCAYRERLDAALDLVHEALATPDHGTFATEKLERMGYYSGRPVLDGRRRLSGAIEALDAALAEARQAVEDVCG